MIRRMVLFALLAIALRCMPALAAGVPFAWPEGRMAAVSLAYDDALDSQLDNAIPALDRRGLKASFYLQLSREPVSRRLGEWRAAASNGHELGNHTLFHQCSGSIAGHDWVEVPRDLDTTTAVQMRDQVLLANDMLYAIDGRHARTFTVPCGDAIAMGGNYVDLVKDAFVAIKFGDGAVTPDMTTLDPAAVTIEAPVDVTGAQLVSIVEDAARRGTMVNLTFHGIGGDYLAVSVAAHDELLTYLAAHRDVYWVDTFINIMTFVKARQSEIRTGR